MREVLRFRGEKADKLEMKHLKLLLYIYCSLLIGPVVWGSEAIISKIIGSEVIQVTDIDGSAILNQKKDHRKLEIGDSFFEVTYLETQDKSLVTLLLPDNSLVYLGPNSVLKIKVIAKNSKKLKINCDLIKGVMRMVSYKGNHVVKSPTGVLAFSAADIEWDVYQNEKKVITDIKKYSGHVINQGEVIQELLASERPEVNNLGIDTLNGSWERWLGEIDQSHDYNLAFFPQFDSQAKQERKIASVKQFDGHLDSNFNLISKHEEKTYNYPKVNNKIYVHENFFDYVLINVEKMAELKAEELVRSAYEIAAKEIVREVASRSLLRWGTHYGQKAAIDEMPMNIKKMFQEIKDRDVKLKKTRIYVDSAERIAQLKSYLTARNTIKNQGVKKAIEETQSYLMALTSKVITPPVEYEVYKYAKEKSSIVANAFLKKSELIKSKDVSDLIEYLSQVAAKKFTKREIFRIEKETSYGVAVNSVVEASLRGVDQMANFIADKVSRRTAELFKKMLDQEIAHREARYLASENQTQLGIDYEASRKIKSAN